MPNRFDSEDIEKCYNSINNSKPFDEKTFRDKFRIGGKNPKIYENEDASKLLEQLRLLPPETKKIFFENL